MRLTPAARISLGLIALAVSLVLIADLCLGFLPSEARWNENARLRSAEALAVQLAVIADDPSALGRTLIAVASRDGSILSMALRNADANLIALAGDHQRYWLPVQPGVPDKGRVRVPMYRSATHWADLEITYRSLLEPAWLAWIQRPSLQVAGVLVSLGFVAYFLYLRRMLQHLDPASVVPERVRMAFDVLTEGVMVLDATGRVVMVNRAFERLLPNESQAIIGRKPSELAWLAAGLDPDAARHPWTRAVREREPVTGDALEIAPGSQSSRKIILNCAPILDGNQLARGCLVTFDDVTALDQVNGELLKTMVRLHSSQDEVVRQNAELRRLATCDSLTGCLNRRALLEAADALCQAARKQQDDLVCIMCDIDQFKKFNDRYGHSLGDQVIQAVAKTLSLGIRDCDLLCRYGGEEFCIVLPSLSAQQAKEIAERLRFIIESAAGATVRSLSGLKITCSFGVASWREAQSDLSVLIDHADEALYASKQGGRNRVTCWAPPQDKHPPRPQSLDSALAA